MQTPTAPETPTGENGNTHFEAFLILAQAKLYGLHQAELVYSFIYLFITNYIQDRENGEWEFIPRKHVG